MDGGPYRPQRPVERRTAARPVSTQHQSSELEIVDDEPRQPHKPTPTKYQQQKSSRGKIALIVAGIVGFIAIAGVVGWIAFSQLNKTSAVPSIDTSKYQAVFFTNGQVYFGKLSTADGDYMSLTDVYYLQTQASGESDAQNPQETATEQNGVQLIKLGDEIHGPEDEMIISKEQVLFYENLKTDGKVAKSIEQYKTSK